MPGSKIQHPIPVLWTAVAAVVSVLVWVITVHTVADMAVWPARLLDVVLFGLALNLGMVLWWAGASLAEVYLVEGPLQRAAWAPAHTRQNAQAVLYLLPALLVSGGYETAAGTALSRVVAICFVALFALSTVPGEHAVLRAANTVAQSLGGAK